MRESVTRVTHGCNNGEEWWAELLASLLDKRRPEKKRIGTATAISGFPLRFLAQRGGVGHGEDAGGQGFGGGALYGRRCATATSVVVHFVEAKVREGVRGGNE